MEYLNSGDLSVQQIDKNPLIHLVEFNNYCKKHSINLLFVPVPSKEEIYPEKIIGENIVPEIPYVNPFGRKVLKDLQDKGVEVIDILPDFLKDKATDTTLLYQLHDTHWTTKGLEITAKRIAERIQKYSWYKEISKNNYSCRDTFFERLGDIVDKLPESSQINYRPSVLSAKQVRDSSGNLFKGNASSPVMLIGDSFTGVFESVDCKSAGVGSHIAYLTGLPIDIITSWGGGPMVRQKAMKAREKNIESKKLIIYMMTDRDLFNYSQSWEHFPALQK
jgi:alginate O-acetyltransferase complex protein AlgJ